MTTILILGGYGQTGRVLARLLVNETECRLILAGRHPERAAPLVAELNAATAPDRVSARPADAADPASLARALAGVDLVLVASSTAAHCATVARAALAAGCDWLDIQYSTAKLNALRELEPEIARAGRCFITDGGFHPGIPAAMVRHAAARFDTLERANVSSVISIDWSALDLGQATKEEFVAEFIGFQSRVFRDGRWQDLGLMAMMQPKTVDFGPPFGRRYGIPMSLAEMDALPDCLPGLRETGFFVGGFNWLCDWIVSPVVMVGLKLAPRRLLPLMTRLQFWSMSAFARPPFGVLLRLDAAGQAGGRPHALTMSLFHEDGYALTAIPVVACVRQWLAGAARRPGLWYQAHIVEPEAFFGDVARLGAQVVVEETGVPAQLQPA